jgi:hypothetical protein
MSSTTNTNAIYPEPENGDKDRNMLGRPVVSQEPSDSIYKPKTCSMTVPSNSFRDFVTRRTCLSYFSALQLLTSTRCEETLKAYKNSVETLKDRHNQFVERCVAGEILSKSFLDASYTEHRTPDNKRQDPKRDRPMN